MDEIREQYSEDEIIDVYDPQHRPTGRLVRRGEPLERDERLLVAHVCVLNGKNEMLCQRRQPAKKHYGGCWDLSAGGFVLSGETSDDYYLARAEADPEALSLEEEEVAEARWFGEEEVAAMISDGRFVDYPLEGIRRVFRLAAEG